jgi:hypothetical protein
MLRNRHAADLLADVRAEIKQLQIREAELRNELLADGADRHGVQWEAVIKDRKQERLDLKAAIAHFGKDAMKPFMRKVKATEVRLIRTRRAAA